MDGLILFNIYESCSCPIFSDNWLTKLAYSQIFSLNICSQDRHDPDLILSDNFGNVSGLIDNESSLKLLDALLDSFHSLLDCHVHSVVLIEHGVDEVTSVAVSTFGHLLKSTKIVHPVELCFLFNLIIAAHEDVDIEGGAGAERLSQLRAEEMRGRFYARLEPSSNLLQRQVSHHEVSKLIPICLLASRSKNFVLVNLNDLIIVVFQREDWSLDARVSTDNNPVFATNTKCGVHSSFFYFLFY